MRKIAYKRSVHRYASEDITKYHMEEAGGDKQLRSELFIGFNHVFNKESRRLNKELGINSVNYISDKNYNKKK